MQALDVSIELKTGMRETVFIPFPNDATYADVKGGEVAQVMVRNMHLPDYRLIPGHEFTALIYCTERGDSWTGEQVSITTNLCC